MKRTVPLPTVALTMLALAALVGGVAATVRADDKKADATGTWKWVRKSPDGQESETTASLKQERNKLTGKVTTEAGEIDIKNGTVMDGNVSFEISSDAGGSEIRVKFAGKLQGDSIKGKAEITRDGNTTTRDWEPKRVNEAKSEAPSIADVVAKIDENFEKNLVKQKIVGMSVVIVHDQDVLLAKGYGYADLACKTPANPQTVYRVGSITKVFTALAVMQLRDAGKLNLDDPIEKYLPEFKIKSRFPDARPVTFRQVASHYSGLPREAPLPYTYQDVTVFPRTEELIASLANTELIGPVDTKFQYSNLGFNILGLAVERIAHEPYADYVTKHILQPLGMKQSGFAVTEELKKSLATGYKAADKSDQHATAPYGAYGQASGMLYSSVADMAEFLKLQFRQGPAGGKQVLGSSALREMTAPQFILNNDDLVPPDLFWKRGSGIGWQTLTAKALQFNHKRGGLNGFNTDIIFNPRHKLGVAVFTNTECDPFDIGFAPLLRLEPVFKRLEDEARAETAKASVKTLRKYEGTYRLKKSDPETPPPFGEVLFVMMETKLSMRLRNVTSAPNFRPLYLGDDVTLETTGKNAFRIGSDSFENEPVYFVEGAKGEIVGVRWRTYFFERANPR
jgi:CubicO group peptidase (beta-lactamase class C family)